MKQLFLAATVAVMGVGAAAAGVDWSQVTGEYTVREDESEVVTDADLPYVNALEKLTVNGTVRFDTTTPPTMPLAGTGLCSKTNGSDWTMSVTWNAFNGTWKFDGSMAINFEAPAALGNNGADSSGNPYSTAIFTNSATLCLSKQPTSSNGWVYRQRIRISGTGKDGMGAIYSAVTSKGQDRQIGNIVLDGDASMAALHFFYLSRGTISLNGHTLSYSTSESGSRLLMLGPEQRIAGPGTIEIASGVPFCMEDSDDVQFLDATPRTRLKLLGNNTFYVKRTGGASCNYPDQYVDIEAHGTCCLWHTHEKIYPTGEPEDCGVVFHGQVNVPTASDILRVCSWLSSVSGTPKCPITLDGDIVGLGKLQIKDDSRSVRDGQYSDYALSGTNSTISGAQYFNMSHGGRVKLAHPGSLGDYAQVSMFNGQLAPAVGGTDDPWTTNDLAKLVGAMAFIGSYSLLALDASAAPDGTNTLSASFWADVAPSTLSAGSAYLGSSAGEVTLTGPVSEKGRFVAAGGTLKLSGTEPILISRAGSKTLNFAKKPGELLIAGTSAVSMPQNGRILLPLATADEPGSETLGQGGRMVVSNATFSIDVPEYPSVSGKNDVWVSGQENDRVITVGAIRGSASTDYSYGILEIGEGADVTSKISLGEGANEVGAVFQTGGTVRNVGQYMNGPRTLGPIMGNCGHGYLEIDGGTWEQHGRTEFAYQTGSTFLLHLKSGTFAGVRHMRDDHASEKGWGSTIYSRAGYAHFYVEGGDFNVWGICAQEENTALDDTVVFTLDGPTAAFTAKDYLIYNYIDKSTGDFIVNLNDGVWTHETGSYAFYARQDGPARFFLNCNGGTLRSKIQFALNDSRENAHVTIYGGGAKFDSDGTGSIAIPRPLRAPKGKGVSAIPLPAALADATFVCPPSVRIAETGEGATTGACATAIAVWNRATGKVTGFKVVCPGEGYVEATATITYGASRSWQQVCTLADNARTGGLLKTGAGTLTLTGANSDYCGLTEVRDGTVTYGANYALSSNSVLRLTGGMVYLGDYAASFPSVGGTGGTLKSHSKRAMTFEHPLLGTTDGFTFSAITPTFGGAWQIAAADLNAGLTAVYNASVAFASGASVTVDDLEALDTGKVYEIFRVSDGKTLTGAPAFADPSGKWRLRTRGNALQLVARRGVVMLVR